MAWLHDVEGTLRCGTDRDPFQGGLAKSHAPSSCLGPDQLGRGLEQICSRCTVRCEAVGLPGAAPLGQRVWERSKRTLARRLRCYRRPRGSVPSQRRCVRSGVTLSEPWGRDGFPLFPPSPPFWLLVRYLRVHFLAARLPGGVMVGALCLSLGVVTVVCLVRRWMSAKCRVRPPVPAGSGDRQS